MPNTHKPADVIRQFWALFLESELAKDGQVPGWRSWWESNQQHHQLAADAESSAVNHVCRNGRDLNEAIAESVLDFKRSLARANRGDIGVSA